MGNANSSQAQFAGLQSKRLPLSHFPGSEPRAGENVADLGSWSQANCNSSSVDVSSTNSLILAHGCLSASRPEFASPAQCQGLEPGSIRV